MNILKYGIKRISSFQLSDGSFSYWPGSNYYDSWGTSYAGHFLLEAESKGYVLPAGLNHPGLKHKDNLARQWRSAPDKGGTIFRMTLNRHTGYSHWLLQMLPKQGQ